MDLGLKGRTAIVSGASSGLGLATAEALAKIGKKGTFMSVADITGPRESLSWYAGDFIASGLPSSTTTLSESGATPAFAR